MSKYITHFQTEAEYQSALPTLDLPNVSLVDELGEVHYHRELYGAHAGDICLYDVAEAQKIVVTSEDWNLTTYPTASYPIVGVVVADESAAGCKVMATLYVDSDGSLTSTSKKYKWQNNSFDWGLTKYTTFETAVTDMNGKANTAAIIAAIKAYDLAHSTDNITGNLGDVIQKMHTFGTVAGDWYIPSLGEQNVIFNNKTAISDTLTKIKNADSNLAVGFDSFSGFYNYSKSSTEVHSSNNWVGLFTNSTFDANRSVMGADKTSNTPGIFTLAII